MKLAKYLADYLRTEFERQEHDDIFNEAIIQQGIEAFASTGIHATVVADDGEGYREVFK
jgi:hypothetical protein